MNKRKALIVAILAIVALAAAIYLWTRPLQGERVANQLAMIDLPGGAYVMGVKEGEEHEQQAYPARTVHIAPFRIGKTNVTFALYDRFAKATGRDLPQDEGFGRDSRPVINVDRQDALAFIAWVNSQSGRHFRLPTEAEWEYAARGGTITPYFWGKRSSADYANLSGNSSGRDHFVATAPVASFLPNGFGLYDMVGNVWEMTADCRHPSLESAPNDGRAWIDSSCDSRIARGGWYGSMTRGSKVTTRSAYADGFRSMALGFRLAEDLPAKAK